MDWKTVSRMEKVGMVSNAIFAKGVRTRAVAGGKWIDRGYAKWGYAKYESKYKNSDDFVLPIMYKIFLPATGRYVEYNKYGSVKPTNI